MDCDIEVRDRADTPAAALACDRCTTPALLRPGGLCADCIAAVGLAPDRTEYDQWRRRIEAEVAAGSPGAR